MALRLFSIVLPAIYRTLLSDNVTECSSNQTDLTTRLSTIYSLITTIRVVAMSPNTSSDLDMT